MNSGRVLILVCVVAAFALPNPASSDQSDRSPTVDPTSTSAAVRGAQGEASGSTAGILGTAASPDGFGLVGAHESDGFDLALDGSSLGHADALFNEEGIDRPSSSDEVFTLFNSGSGTLILSVEGNVESGGRVLGKSLWVPSGQVVGDDRSITATAVSMTSLDASAATAVVLPSAGISGAGAGSGLDADVLDGLQGSAYATTADLAGSGGAAVHWDNLTAIPGDLADGDDDTTYSGGDGISVSGGVIAVDRTGEAPGHVETAIASGVAPRYVVSSAVGSDGLPVVAYFDEASSSLRAAFCENPGCTAVTDVLVDDQDFPGGAADLLIGADGLLFVAYWTVASHELKAAHCLDRRCSTVDITAVSPTSAPTGWHVQAVVDMTGLPILAYQDPSAEIITLAYCLDIGCSSATIVPLLGTEGGTDPAITVLGDGSLLLAFQLGGTLATAHLTSPYVPPTVTIVDASSSVGGGAAIATGADGLGIVAYHDAVNDHVKTAHCETVSCSAATLTTLPYAAAVSSANHALVVRPDGRPLIVAAGEPTGRDWIQVASCTDPACTGALVFEYLAPLDCAGNLATIDVTIGHDGYPMVAIGDPDAMQLTAIHCSNPFCVPHFRPW